MLKRYLWLGLLMVVMACGSESAEGNPSSNTDDAGGVADDAESGGGGDGPLRLDAARWPIEFGASTIAVRGDGVVGAVDVDGVTTIMSVSSTADVSELAVLPNWSQGRIASSTGSGLALDIVRSLSEPSRCAYLSDAFETAWEYVLVPNRAFLGATEAQALTAFYAKDPETGLLEGPLIEAISTATTPPTTLWSLDQKPLTTDGEPGIFFQLGGAMKSGSGWFMHGSYVRDSGFSVRYTFDLRHYDDQGQLVWRYHLDDPIFTRLSGVVQSDTGLVACGDASARVPDDDLVGPAWGLCVGVGADGVEEWRTEFPAVGELFTVRVAGVVSPDGTDAIAVLNPGVSEVKTVAVRVGPDGVAWQQELPVDDLVLGVAYSGGALWISTAEHLYRFVESDNDATP